MPDRAHSRRPSPRNDRSADRGSFRGRRDGICPRAGDPEWPGRFEGHLLHSGDYRNAQPFRGLRVLVVGAGNSGSDIAIDLAEGGARQVWLSVRRPPCVVPRQALGVPAQVAGIVLHRLPPRLSDAFAAMERRAFIGSLDSQGLPGYRNPVFSRRRRDGTLPILDAGFAARLREGAFRTVPGVEGFAGARVCCRVGRRCRRTW